VPEDAMAEIKVGMQVDIRSKIPSGNLIRIGNVMQIDAEKHTARVHCPTERLNLTVPLASISPTSARNGSGIVRRTVNPYSRVFRKVQ
jgi:hypothetical protein